MWLSLVVGAAGQNTPTSGSLTLSDVWPILAVMFGGAAGVFGYMTKLISDERSKNDKLTEKITDQVIPAMVQNTEATKAMVEATARLQAATAVAEDRRERRR